MSWLFGEISKKKNSFSNFSNEIRNQILHSVTNDDVNIFAGGNSNNLYHIKKSNIHYFISGIGITTTDGISRVMDSNDWQKVLDNNTEKILNTDGHYVIIKIANNLITIITDKLGLRDIYIREFDDKIIFSTKIEWLTYFKNIEIDFNIFGSRWLLHNQISHEAIFKNHKRLLTGNVAVINIQNNYKITYQQYNIKYSHNSISPNEIEVKLLSLLNLRVKDSEKLSLSLSGGMDSRVLLSLLINNRTDFFETHSFGNPNHPDCLIANRMITDFNIPHYQYNETDLNADNLIADLETYTIDNIVNNAASSILQLNNYKFLSNRNLIVVDGAPGEIWRHEYFFVMLLKGRKALLDGNINIIISFLKMQRADIFNDDVNYKMQNGLSNQFAEAFTHLPKISENNIREWLDLFAIRTRIPNYIGHEQSRLDGLITGVMPFAQISLLSNLFSLNSSWKKNAKLFRKIIKQNSPELAKYPLVKGASQHPFYLNTLLSRIWPRVVSKIGKPYSEVSNTDLLLLKLKEYIYDCINSRVIRESSSLDYNKIIGIVDDYYIKGSNGYSLDWLLSFLFFKQSISKKNLK